MNAEDLIGKALGTCTLQQLIGQGGMGAVFLAQQSRPRRQVAVKVLFPFTPLNPGQKAAFLERFRRETDAAASLVHPNIMPVHEYGEQDGLAYLVMPYLSGGTLRDVLEREGRLPLAQTSNYLEQLAAALEVAHGRGVIHRDLKPANVMLTQEGRLVLTDFGLVKILSDGQSAQVRLTGLEPLWARPTICRLSKSSALQSIYVLIFTRLAACSITWSQGVCPLKGHSLCRWPCSI
ncbi:hypothetical protein KSD_34830 [Ktedonobacter sp. SOSP1-85]|uniref:serine/threonine-protein kinase n=1 Tax=Ktedonobacter sp. SOSP1-85 TaxID=2778367 RepID=UPI001916A20D|nr:serine/threonine-protein kinase [Ktedonobacter sp. SOSP1-85]GHO75712.1 hypothetical protein KSD_34830 [Ktedonobacter sp. SOSP1-85]